MNTILKVIFLIGVLSGTVAEKSALETTTVTGVSVEAMTVAAEPTTVPSTTTTTATTIKATTTTTVATSTSTTPKTTKATTVISAKSTTKLPKPSTKANAKKIAATTTVKPKTIKTSLKTTTVGSTTTSSAVSPTTVSTTTAVHSTSTVASATTTVKASKDERFPFEIRDQAYGIRVRQCSCEEREECAREARERLPACRQRCVALLDYFGGRNVSEPAAGQCFPSLAEELIAIDNCMASNVADLCSSEPSSVTYIQPSDGVPSSAAYQAASDAALDAQVADGGPRSVRVKKARHAFARLRDFQACAWKCVLNEAAGCESARGCTSKYPAADALAGVLAGCEAARFRDHSVATCHCLHQKHAVHRHFMARI